MNSYNANFVTSFPIMTSIPDGCRLHLITDERHVPHLRPGEWVVLDATPVDRLDDGGWGEVSLLRQRGGDKLWCVRKETEEQRNQRVDKSGICVWLRPLDNCRSYDEVMERLDVGAPVHMSDGPLIGKYLPPMIVGKVVGLYEARAVALIEASS